jgi:hypothetical protein
MTGQSARVQAAKEPVMLNRTTLTALYLDELKRRGARASELLGTMPESELLNAFYYGRYLSRPLFIGHEERDRLYADLEDVRAALVSLPDRLFGGDLEAFARSVAADDVYVSAIVRSRGAPVSVQARADLYADSSGFRLLEYNMGSALGGMDNADMCRALLEHPLLAEFAQTHRLGYVDTMREQVHDMLAECGVEPGSFPMVAVTDWPSSYENDLGPYMRRLATRWRELGLDAHACHVGELEVHRGRVRLGGRAVDIIARMFLIHNLLESPEAPALIDPILDAVARGEVQMFTPLDSELLGSKGALAILSDERNRHLFSAAELASFDRIVPWTRMVRPGPVALEDGREVDLLGYAITHQEDLVLKPTMLASGKGVLLGWHRDTTPQLWRDRLTTALDGPYVIQRRIRPVPELFPDDYGELVPWIVAWGVFTVVNGYGGILTRGHPVGSDIAVISVLTGASAGCCLSTLPDSG